MLLNLKTYNFANSVWQKAMLNDFPDMEKNRNYLVDSKIISTFAN